MHQDIIDFYLTINHSKAYIQDDYFDTSNITNLALPRKAAYNIDMWEECKIDDQRLAQCSAEDFETNFTTQKQYPKKSLTLYSQVTETTGVIIDQHDCLDRLGGLLYERIDNLPNKQKIQPPQVIVRPQIFLNDRATIKYNKGLVKKIRKTKIKGKNRYSNLFMPRFKWKIKENFDAKNPQDVCEIKQLNNINGMSDPTMDQMLNILQIQNLFGIETSVREMAEEYTSSQQILLDAFFPIKTLSGKFRARMLEKTSEVDFIRFLSSYEMIPKFMSNKQIPRWGLTFQNCRYYNVVTERQYSPFAISE